MKKIITIMIIAAMTLSILAGCGKKSEEETTSMAKETTEETTKKSNGGSVNPMQEITDSSEFEKELGIKFDSSKISANDVKMFIINGSIADVRWTVVDSSKKSKEINFRATKDEMDYVELSGISDENISSKGKEYFSTMLTEVKYSPSLDTYIICFEKNDTKYTVTYQHEAEEGLIEAVMNYVLNAADLK